MPYNGPTLTLKWGDYYKPDATEEGLIVDTAIKAKEGGIATLRQAVEMTKRVLGVENVDAAVEALKEEAEERAKRDNELAHAAGAEDDAEPGEGEQPDAGGAGSAGRGKGAVPPQAPRRRGAAPPPPR